MKPCKSLLKYWGAKTSAQEVKASDFRQEPLLTLKADLEKQSFTPQFDGK